MQQTAQALRRLVDLHRDGHPIQPAGIAHARRQNDLRRGDIGRGQEPGTIPHRPQLARLNRIVGQRLYQVLRGGVDVHRRAARQNGDQTGQKRHFVRGQSRLGHQIGQTLQRGGLRHSGGDAGGDIRRQIERGDKALQDLQAQRPATRQAVQVELCLGILDPQRKGAAFNRHRGLTDLRPRLTQMVRLAGLDHVAAQRGDRTGLACPDQGLRLTCGAEPLAAGNRQFRQADHRIDDRGGQGQDDQHIDQDNARVIVAHPSPRRAAARRPGAAPCHRSGSPAIRPRGDWGRRCRAIDPPAASR